MVHRECFVVETRRGRGTYALTEHVQRAVGASGLMEAVCTVFVHHTSASLLITENADPQVRRDLHAFLERLVPDGDALFRHVAEGTDDMSAHVRSALTLTSVSLPVHEGRCDLGTWQGLYLWEHRARPHRRRISVTTLA